MFDIPEWPENAPVWGGDALQLLLQDAESKISPSTLQIIQENSEAFQILFPIQSVRCKSLAAFVKKETLEKNINSVYPVLHENALMLFSNFLLHKRKFGNEIERKFYNNMSLLQLVDRLLTKRAVVFINRQDKYYLMDGLQGNGKWESIGTTSETENLNLSKCLSYDEIKISALLSVSSYTNFINDGNRNNMGKLTRANMWNRETVEPNGIIIGLIGARFKRPKAMEYQEVVITEDQNQGRNGYGTQSPPTLRTLFSGFYGEACLTYGQAVEMRKENPDRFTEVCKGVLFDNNVYCKRMILSIDTLLLEADERAKERGAMAFVHVVGIGLGVWRMSSHQNSLLLDTFIKRIQKLGSHLHHVSDVVFAYFGDDTTSGGYKHGDTLPIPGHPKDGIKIHICQREPHTKLSGKDKGKLLVVSYAWDGNALPGNEFWLGILAGSGDSAAACSTQISELHNPHINPLVSANTLRIATPAGVIPFFEYRKTCQKQEN